MKNKLIISLFLIFIALGFFLAKSPHGDKEEPISPEFSTSNLKEGMNPAEKQALEDKTNSEKLAKEKRMASFKNLDKKIKKGQGQIDKVDQGLQKEIANSKSKGPMPQETKSAFIELLKEVESSSGPKSEKSIAGLQGFKELGTLQLDEAVNSYQEEVLIGARKYSEKVSLAPESSEHLKKLLKKENLDISDVLIDFLNNKVQAEEALNKMWRIKRQNDFKALEFVGDSNKESYRAFRKEITPGDGEYFFMGETE